MKNNIQKIELIFSKLFILALCVFTVLPAFSQKLKPIAQMVAANNVAETGKKIDIFTVSSLALEAVTVNKQVLKEATFVTPNKDKLHELYQIHPKTMTFAVPFKGEILYFDLVEVNILTEDFKVTTKKGEVVDYQYGRYYQGIVKGDNKSIVALSIFKNEVIGMASSNTLGNLSIGQIPNALSSDHIIYSDLDLLVANDFTCEATAPKQDILVEQKNMAAAVQNTNNCVRVYFECTNAYYVAKGSNTTNVTNHLTAAFNNVALLYSNESINTTISEIYIWTTVDSYSTSNNFTALNQFGAMRPTFNGDIAHLLNLKSPSSPGGGGIAWLDILCENGYKYAYSQIFDNYGNIPIFSWTIEVLTHEMGHNLGSPHTHSCSWPGGAIDNCYTVEGSCSPGSTPTNGGTIMSYCHLSGVGINFNNGFGTLPGNLIRNRVYNAACLGTSCSVTPTCAATSIPSVSNITSTSATVTWTAVTGAASYKVEYKRTSDTEWQSLPNSTNSLNLTALQASSNYLVRVTTNCSNGETSTASTEKTFTTLIACNPPATTVSTITYTSARINWAALTGIQGYEVRYKVKGAAVWVSPIKTAVATATFLDLTALLPSTAYEYQIRLKCTATNISDYSETREFSTQSCDPPVSSVTQITLTSARVEWTAISGVQGFELHYRVKDAATWVTPTKTAVATATFIDVTNLVPGTIYEYELRLKCTTTAFSNYGLTKAFTTLPCVTPVCTSANIGLSGFRINVTAVTGALGYELRYRKQGDVVWLAKNPAAPTAANPSIFSDITGLLPGTNYEVQVRTKCTTTGFSDYSGILVVTTSPCVTPNYTPANIGLSGFRINVAVVTGALGYELRYRKQGDVAWLAKNPAAPTAANPSIFSDITGLLPGTNYEVQVRTKCTTIGFSDFGESLIVTTSPCVTPNYTSANITLSSFRINIGAITGALGYELRYRKVGDVTWLAKNPVAPAVLVDITGLLPGTTYEVQVRAKCTTIGFSDFSASLNVLTLPCTNVTSYSVASTMLTPTTARVSWTGITGILGYEIAYKLPSTTTYITKIATATGTFIDLTGLVANTLYDVRVRVKCTTTGYSDWLNKQFKTACPKVVSAPTVSLIGTKSAYFKWTNVGNVTGYNLQWKKTTDVIWRTTGSVYRDIYLPDAFEPSTQYQARVVTVCDNINGVYGDVSPIATFTTLAATCTEITEPNNTAATAKPLTTATPIRGKISTTTDEDWFKITVAAYTTVYLSDLPANYDLSLYDAAGTILIRQSANATTVGETVFMSVAGTYSIQVKGSGGVFDANTCYNLAAYANIPLPAANTLASMDNDTNISIVVPQPKIAMGSNGIDQLIVAPNPTSGIVSLHLNIAEEGIGELTISDYTGRVVMTMNDLSLVRGDQIKEIDLSKFTNGIYFIRLIKGDSLLVSKIQLIKN